MDPWVLNPKNTNLLEEEQELEPAIHPPRAGALDVTVAVLATGVVVGASVAMELTASKLGARHHVAEIVIGPLVLAGVTSLPNAVAAVYLAARGRGTATLSTAMNSNALNVAAGLLLPGMIVGLGGSSGPATLIAGWYFGLTAFALGCAYLGRGLRRWHGTLIIGAYLAFVAMVLSSAYSSRTGVLLSAALPLAAGLIVAGWMIRSSGRRHRNGRSVVGDDETRHPLEQGHAVVFTGLSDADARNPTAVMNGSTPSPVPPPRDTSLIAGWSIRRMWWIALAITSIIAAIDAMLGHRVILIGLLISGPCCGLLTGRWRRTATAGGWAVALAVLLGVPDNIWGTTTHLAFLGAVLIVTVASTVSAAVIQRHGHTPTP